MATLAPCTGIIRTAIQSGMTHIDAVSEFVDNSFGEAAGNADEITIIDCKDGTLFMDQGRGVSNLNLLFRLGDGESRNSATDIGRFGVGSKFGALTFGTNVAVHSVRDGRYHAFAVDWAKVMESGKWPNEYNGAGQDARQAPAPIRDGGTIIVIQDLHKGRSRPTDKTYIKRLGLRFMPSLIWGKNITVYRAASIAKAMSGDFQSKVEVKKQFDKELKKKFKHYSDVEITVAGQTANASFAEIPDGDTALAGVHIAYGGRVIKTLDKLNGERVPAKLFARVDLGSGFKEFLSYNKTEITEHMDDLEKAIYEAGEMLIARLAKAESTAVTDRLAAAISNMMHGNFGKRLLKDKMQRGEFDMEDGENLEDVTSQREDGNEDNKPEGPNDEIVQKPKKRREGSNFKRQGAFKFQLDAMAAGANSPAVRASLIEEEKQVVCRVILNSDIEIVQRALKGNPGNKPAVMILAINALANLIAHDEQWLMRLFEGERADALLNTNPLERNNLVLDEIMRMVVAEDDQAIPEAV